MRYNKNLIKAWNSKSNGMCHARCCGSDPPWHHYHSSVYLSERWPFLLHFSTVVITMNFNIKETSSGQFVQKWHRGAGGIPETNRAILMPRNRRSFTEMNKKQNKKTQSQDIIPFKEQSENKIQETNFIATYPVSNKSFVKDSAPAIFPPLIGHS